MRLRAAFLYRPCQPAVDRRQDGAIGADCPTARTIVGSKSYGVQVVFARCGDRVPFLTTVVSLQHQPPRAHNKRSLPINDVEAIERVDQTGLLALPAEAAIGSVKNYAIVAYRPAMQFVRRESDGA